MKKIETLFIWIGLFAVLIVTGTLLWQLGTNQSKKLIEYPTNKYGAFLVSQHAIYVNDFEMASKYANQITDSDIKLIKETKILSNFLNGNLPDEKTAESLKKDSGMAMGFVYDAYLVKKDDWKSIYEKHKKDDSSLTAPLRIWSGVATGKTKETFKYIDSLKTNDSWKSFIRGQIYAETNNIKKAVEHFAKVSPTFLNINDYLYLMAFYQNNNMPQEVENLRKTFTENAGGMFMLDMEISPKWSEYNGYRNALAFSLLQNVSHTQIIMYSDLSLLMMRFAEIIGDEKNNNILNYYIGQYFFNNGGDYKKHFNKIEKNSPLYPFSLMKMAEKADDVQALEAAVDANPLFTPATIKLIAKNVQSGNEKKALNIINKALENKNITTSGRAFFLKIRASVYTTFNDLEKAQADISESINLNPNDSDTLAKQSRIWIMQKRELGNAYNYVVALVRQNPTNLEYWDLLGMAVLSKEGPESALDILKRVGEVAQNCSILFEHLGDLYADTGNNKLAYEYYMRAIELSDDGLTIVPKLEKKIKALK